MPWRELKPMDEKVLFIADYLRELYSFTVLCERFGISRKTGYKWVERYRQSGLEGLGEQSRRRHHQALTTPYVIREYILDLRRRSNVDLGPKKIQVLVEQCYPGQSPSRTTIYNILKQAGLISPRRLRQRVPAYAKPLHSAKSPNDLWTADYKGQFLTRDGQWCYPLTIMDHASRYLLACDGLLGPRLAETQVVFERLFRTYGLPARMRTDNGTPFVSKGRAGLSQLSIWWLRLGILPERIAPGRPEQNGRHERMHRTLKLATAQLPEPDLKRQQARFDEFLRHYNHERLHEALEQKTPAQLYVHSSRPFPSRLPEPSYASHIEVYRVDSAGLVNRRGMQIYVGSVLQRQLVGLELIGDGVWAVHFGPIIIGKLDERERSRRYLKMRVSPM
ncbi:integrase core domain-containing protein [Pseudomonas sp. NY15181]|uniref:integrase core domain-containing protein n=1 Tax=Pseudomonas sp. NY15181 TaxID=3400349 RepID=UPI003A8BC218